MDFDHHFLLLTLPSVMLHLDGKSGEVRVIFIIICVVVSVKQKAYVTGSFDLD